MNQDPAQAERGEAKEKEDDDSSLWSVVIGGACAVAAAGYFYYDLAQFEEKGGTHRIWWPVAIAYNIAGKWPVVGIFAAIGIALLAWGLHGVFTGKKSL